MRNIILPLILCTTLIFTPGQVYVFEVPAKSIKADVAPLNLKTLIRLYPLIVNGSFFDPPTKTVLGFVISEGRVLNKGVFKDAIVVKDGKAELTTLKHTTNLNVDFAISGGPVLVKNGRVVVGKERSEVRLSLRQRAKRCGIGILNSQTLIVIVSLNPVTLIEFAHMFLNHKATDALNLDGGNSVFLAYKGKVYSWKRTPLNVLMAETARKLN